MKKNGTGTDFFGCAYDMRVSPARDLCPLQWKWGVLTSGPPGDSLDDFFCEAFDTADNAFVNSFGNVMAYERSFPGSSDSKESACSAGDRVQSLKREDLLEKEMATHSSILAWKIPRTEEPGRLQSRIRLSNFTHLWKEQHVYG